MLPLIPIIGAVLTVVGLGIDWKISDNMADSVSQMEYLLNNIQYMTFSDFVSQCWLVILCGFFIFWLGLWIAFPKKRSKMSGRVRR